MGKRGPQPLSAQQLQLRGSWRATERFEQERTAAEEADRGAGMPVPEPPKWLSHRAKEFWRRLLPSIRKLTGYPLDEPMLASFCEAYDELRTATELIQKEGPIVKSGKHGGKSRHPAVMIAASARSSIVAIAREMGLSPKAREALNLEVVYDKPDMDETEEARYDRS